jgi:tRNA(Arg) A34 adenosine deaminase TadA
VRNKVPPDLCARHKSPTELVRKRTSPVPASFSVGHNRRVQDGDPISHGEMDCLRRAGRRRRYDELTLYTTLSPCIMCSGAVLQFGIRRLVVGENRNFHGNINFLRSRGVHVILVDDSDCVEPVSLDVWEADRNPAIARPVP